MGVGKGHGEGSGDSRGKQERLAVPAMPMPVAILCCVLNFLVPGLGTILAGLSTFCCARNEDMSGCKRLGSCCISFGIGLLQLLTTALLLVGWIWSCVWGTFFIGMSSEYYHDNPPDNDRGTVVNRQSPQTVIVTQPAGGGGYQYPQGGQYQQQQPGSYPQPYGQPQAGFPQAGAQHPPAYPGPAPQAYGGGWEPPPPYTEQPPATPSAPPAEKVLQ